MSEGERTITDRLADIYTWMREPDWVEVASIEWLIDWVERRPVADLAMVAMLIPAQSTAKQCRNCSDPISDGVFCGMCREMGCTESSGVRNSETEK